jgi:hypothetical protein
VRVFLFWKVASYVLFCSHLLCLIKLNTLHLQWLSKPQLIYSPSFLFSRIKTWSCYIKGLIKLSVQLRLSGYALFCVRRKSLKNKVHII